MRYTQPIYLSIEADDADQAAAITTQAKATINELGWRVTAIVIDQVQPNRFIHPTETEVQR